MSVVLGVVLLVFPWLGLPLTLIGFVGMGKASMDLFHAFWDGLGEAQKLQVTMAAHEAGVSLGSFFSNEAEGMGPVAAARP